MKMIIHQMDLKKDFKVELKKHPTNLYRDDKMKTQINFFLNNSLKTALSLKHSSDASFRNSCKKNFESSLLLSTNTKANV